MRSPIIMAGFFLRERNDARILIGNASLHVSQRSPFQGILDGTAPQAKCLFTFATKGSRHYHLRASLSCCMECMAMRYYLKFYRSRRRRSDGAWAWRGAASADARRAILPRELESSGSVKNTLHRRPR